jgi:hypothetical protein
MVWVAAMMTTQVSTAQPQTGDLPYAQPPEHASTEQRAQYRANFTQAAALARQKDNTSPREKYLRDRVLAYLRSSFDPRPFEEIEADFRSIVTNDLNRV